MRRYRKLALLAAMMQNLGGNIAVDQIGFPNLDEFKDTGNVALVNVTVTVPATGIIQGELLDCGISAIHAKSLKGGVLFNAILLRARFPMYRPSTAWPAVASVPTQPSQPLALS